MKSLWLAAVVHASPSVPSTRPYALHPLPSCCRLHAPGLQLLPPVLSVLGQALVLVLVLEPVALVPLQACHHSTQCSSHERWFEAQRCSSRSPSCWTNAGRSGWPQTPTLLPQCSPSR